MTTTRQSAQQQGQYLLQSSINAAAQLIDSNSNLLIAMDKSALNHIFGDPKVFIGGKMPIEPIKVIGLGEAQATGYGNVSIKLRCNEGKIT